MGKGSAEFRVRSAWKSKAMMDDGFSIVYGPSSKKGCEMRQFARAMMRLPLAASLYGMKHLSGRFAASTGGDVLPRAEAQLGRLMREAFKTGDRLTADVVDPALGFVTQEGLSSGHVMKLGFDATQKLAEVFGPWANGSDLAWLEFGNKLQSFGTFRYVASMLDMPVETDIPLAQWVAQAAKLEIGRAHV